MRIPYRFEVLGRTIRVTRSRKVNLDAFGEYNSERDTITIYRTARTPELQAHTFCHELMHVLLEAAGRPDLSDDEGFVDTMGGLLHQALSTARYRGGKK